MTATTAPDTEAADRAVPAPDYLCVDRYLRNVVDARSLKTAFEIGLIDFLVQRGSSPLAQLQQATATDARGLAMLLALLGQAGVLTQRLGDVSLQPGFVAALRFRDLLETKLDFAGFLLDDFADHFTALVRDPQRFVAQGRLFELFDYRLALGRSFEGWKRTRAWMRLTSTLTRYEARALMAMHDFGAHRRALDVGGNSGEFMLQLCRRHPALHATVFDLPMVCDIGLEHLLTEPEAARIAFVAGDLRSDALPLGHDLISFKSMLHDWPQDDADRFLASAVQALAPGGTLLIAERGPVEQLDRPAGFGDLPVLLFFRSYRSPDAYLARLAQLGLHDLRCQTLQLDTPFTIVTGRKAGA
jgi:SAM-dependent methyltransferase